MKVYKGTDKDMKCRGFQYKLGEKVTSDDAIRCGNKGFHACEAPMDVLRYYPIGKGNRYFEAEADGKIDKAGNTDTKLASSELMLKAEISLKDLVKAQVAYTRAKAESGTKGGDWSNLAGGNESDLAGGDWSNLAGGDESNLAGGDWSNLAGGYRSNLAGGYRSNLAGGDRSNLAGGYRSDLAGGNESNLAGGDESNLAGGDWSIIIGRNYSKVKGGMWSVMVLTEWELVNRVYKPVHVKAVVVDGEAVKPDTWYTLKDGELKVVEE